MKCSKSLLVFATLALAFALSGSIAAAQPDGGGGMGAGGGLRQMMGDPAQRAQAQVNNMRETLVVTNDAEWDIIAPRLLKVVQLRSDNSTSDIAKLASSFAGMMGGGADGRGGNGAGLANLLGVQSDPTTDALKAALDGNAPVAQIKVALANYRAAKQAKQAEMAKAQAALKEVLTVRQEATLTLSGFLD